MQKTFEKRIEPYQNNNIHGFLFSKDKENSSFQILFPLIRYVRFGDEKHLYVLFSLEKELLIFMNVSFKNPFKDNPLYRVILFYSFLW